jgi:hypothetical protein
MWKKILAAFERAGRARAAAEFMRLGRPDLAKKIMCEGNV